ncbi:hemolysin family protein [Thermodesulfobacteriota bacterium]
MTDWTHDIVKILLAFLLVLINGFFVAAEFALVKTRRSRLEQLVKIKRPFSATALWLMNRMDPTLSACQLGITMASLGLGWIGEPAVAHLLRPLLISIGIQSEIVIHGVAFFIAFTSITAAHLVLGEQAPKIAAIRNPETAFLWSAVPLKLFYFLSYPFLVALNATTAVLLKKFGVEGSTEEDAPHNEDEIRRLIHHSHIHGELSRSEHRLISSVLDFDELNCRREMVPRPDIVFLDAGLTFSETIKITKETQHSRYPVCEGSLDKVIGVVHIKDLVGISADAPFDLRSIMRPPQFIPETLLLRRLLRQFQATHQHMAFVVDEYGTVSGIITLENVLEAIIGSVEDEFDMESPDIIAEGPKQFVVSGNTSIDVLNRRFGLVLVAQDIDTISGLLMTKTDKLPVAGEKIGLSGAVAEVLEVKDLHATRIRLSLADTPPEQT